MTISMGDVQLGMEVYGSEGKKLGKVNEVFSDPSSDEPHIYFTVDHGGVLGIGATVLSIPFSAIQRLGPGHAVTLDCTDEQANARYAK